MRILRAAQISICAAALSAALALSTTVDSWDKKTIVTFGDSVEIPGQVLPTGAYVFKLASSMSNRHIVEIWNQDETRLIATVLAIPDYRPEPPSDSRFEFDERPSNSPMALRT
ncbi:MAG: hypothetical protein WBE13_19510 [Candidatus Acidiferrum sp.]